MGKFWKFTGKTMQYFNRTLRQIQKNTGEVGGWIENENSLPQTGNCWLDKNSKIHGNSKLSGHVTLIGTEVIDSILNDRSGIIYKNCVVFNSKISYSGNDADRMTLLNKKIFNVTKKNIKGFNEKHGDVILHTINEFFDGGYEWITVVSINNSQLMVSVGCQTHTIEVWKRIYKNFVEQYSLSQRYIDFGFKLLESAPSLKTKAETDLHNYYHKFGQPRTNGKFVKAPKFF